MFRRLRLALPVLLGVLLLGLPAAPLRAATGGSAWGWGADDRGQLGAGMGVGHGHAPRAVAAVPRVVAVAAGDGHALALDADGAVWAWGADARGQLGGGDAAPAAQPRRVAGLPPSVAIAAGGEHSLALDAGGGVWAWGADDRGQIGPGAADPSPRPAAVPGLPPIAAIAAGGAHSLALSRTGEVWAWGDNRQGQLGGGTGCARPPCAARPPARVQRLREVVAIAAGSEHSLALTRSGTVWAWGGDRQGQLGLAGAARPGRALPVPRRVVGLAHVAAIAAGGGHSLALDAAGGIWSWGANSFGQLGRPAADTCPGGLSVIPCGVLPRPVQGPPGGAAALAGGRAFSLALDRSGAVWAWGRDDGGQLGAAPADTCTSAARAEPCATTPIRVPGLDDAVAVAAGADFALALRAAGPGGPAGPPTQMPVPQVPAATG